MNAITVLTVRLIIILALPLDHALGKDPALTFRWPQSGEAEVELTHQKTGVVYKDSKVVLQFRLVFDRDVLTSETVIEMKDAKTAGTGHFEVLVAGDAFNVVYGDQGNGGNQAWLNHAMNVEGMTAKFAINREGKFVRQINMDDMLADARSFLRSASKDEARTNESLARLKLPIWQQSLAVPAIGFWRTAVGYWIGEDTESGEKVQRLRTMRLPDGAKLETKITVENRGSRPVGPGQVELRATEIIDDPIAVSQITNQLSASTVLKLTKVQSVSVFESRLDQHTMQPHWARMERKTTAMQDGQEVILDSESWEYQFKWQN